MKTLGIESSCDDTAAAVYDGHVRSVCSSVIDSQIPLHARFGGVIPEIASRAHVEKIAAVVTEALRAAGCTLAEIDTIAVTTKPGLAGSLLVGLCFAKGIAYAAHKKLVGVNHLEGHIASAYLEQQVPFPHLCLTASGGHTALYLVTDYGAFQLLGQTRDDAAGEAFDKISKLLGLGYPGGPHIERLAAQGAFEDVRQYPRLKNRDLSFSFSGLKTAVLYDLVKRDEYNLEQKKLHVLAEAQQIEIASSLLCAVGDIFIDRLTIACAQHQVKAITFVGGVACNKYLRERIAAFAQARGLSFATPSPRYCTDNGAMIAFVGDYKAQRGEYSELTLDIYE